MTSWYLIYTKIRQERIALENLERQGFECFLPKIKVEKVRRGACTSWKNLFSLGICLFGSAQIGNPKAGRQSAPLLG